MLRICPRILIVLALSATGLLRLALVNYEGRESPWMTLAADDQANHLVLDPPKCRVLLTDLVFPSVYSKWRLNEVQAFMEFFYTDVLVCKHTDIYSNVRFTIDWEPLLSSHHLASYDILIFDPDYNYLQQYNDPSFNGTAFKHQLPPAYLLRLRAFRSEHVDIHAYDGGETILENVRPSSLLCHHLGHVAPFAYSKSKHRMIKYRGDTFTKRTALTFFQSAICGNVTLRFQFKKSVLRVRSPSQQSSCTAVVSWHALSYSPPFQHWLPRLSSAASSSVPRRQSW